MTLVLIHWMSDNGLWGPVSAGTEEFRNTIIANSLSGSDCDGFVTSLGHNLDSDGSCGLTGLGDLSSVNPLLGPLQNNGGPTYTHALLPSSPAIDAGNPAAPSSGASACEATDQRGVARPVDGDGDGTATCDIGAYEYDDGPEPEMDVQGNGSSIADGDTTPSTADYTYFGSAAVESGSVTRTFTIQNIWTADLSLSDNPRVTMGGTHAADFTLTSDATSPVPPAGQTTFQVTFDPSGAGLRQATVSIANNDADENPYNFSIQGTGTVSPEMEVKGNGSSITDGDTTPSTADHTDFGNVAVESDTITRIFTILNTGGADLNLTDSPRVTIGGTHAADFTLTSDAGTPIAASGQTTFQVTFDPSAMGLRQATIGIANNDADENPYNFDIQGTGTTSIYLPVVMRGGFVIFELQTGSPIYVPDERGCEHMGVGGKVFDLQGIPIVGLAVRMGGELGGLNIGLLDTLTGSAADRFGFGGYYFELSDKPVASESTLWIQVLDPSSSLPLSNKAFLDTFENCEQNLVLVNWQQVGE